MTLYKLTSRDCRSLDGGLRWEVGERVALPKGERGLRCFYRDPDLALLMEPISQRASYGQDVDAYRRDVRLWEAVGEVETDLSWVLYCRTATLIHERPLPVWHDGGTLELRVRVRFALLAAAMAQPAVNAAAQLAVAAYWGGVQTAVERILAVLREQSADESLAAAKAAGEEAAHWAKVAARAPGSVEHTVYRAVTAAGEVMEAGHCSGAAHYELAEVGAAHWGAAEAARAAADGALALVAIRAAGAAVMAAHWAETWGKGSIDLAALARRAVEMEIGEARDG